jgi:hypothetical protein
MIVNLSNNEFETQFFHVLNIPYIRPTFLSRGGPRHGAEDFDMQMMQDASAVTLGCHPSIVGFCEKRRPQTEGCLPRRHQPVR